jgi:PhnB protein
MTIQSYLFFDGRCDEAIEFYKKAVGAEVAMLMRWKDSPDKTMCAPGNENKVMHSCLKIGDASVMASDGRNTGNPKFDGFALSLNVKTDAEAQTRFKALSEGGEVAMPLGPTFFATSFGMVKDRFGVNWMVIKQKPM